MNEPESDIDAADLAEGVNANGDHRINRIRFSEFAGRLKQAMDINNVKAWDVGARLGVSGQMVGKYLRGESLPAIPRMQMLADLVKLPIEELLKGTGISPDDVIRRRGLRSAVGFSTAEGRRSTAHDVTTRHPPADLSDRHSVEFSDRPRPLGPVVREVVYYRTREKLADQLSSAFKLADPGSGPMLRLAMQPIDAGRLFDLRPAVALIDRNEWKLAIEVRVGRPSHETLVGYAYNWRLSTNTPLFLLIARRPERSYENRQWYPYDDEDYDEALIGTSMEPGRYASPPAPARSGERPPFSDRYLRGLDAMVSEGLYRGISIVNYDPTHRVEDCFPDAFGFDAMLEQVAETALT
jgi:hypothetical protein